MAELLAAVEPDTASQQRAGADWIQEIERRAHAAAAAGCPGVFRAEAQAQIQGRLSGR